MTEQDIDAVIGRAQWALLNSSMATSLQLRCDIAIMNLSEFIDAAAERARDQIHRDFTRTRAALGLKRLLSRSRPARLPPRFTCPECGGWLFVEVDEWYAERRIPTRGGYRVLCGPDTIAEQQAWDRDEDHRGHFYGYFGDWPAVEQRVGQWILRNCEVSD